MVSFELGKEIRKEVVSKSNHSTSRHIEKALIPQHLIPVPMVNMKPLSQYTMVSNVI